MSKTDELEKIKRSFLNNRKIAIIIFGFIIIGAIIAFVININNFIELPMWSKGKKEINETDAIDQIIFYDNNLIFKYTTYSKETNYDKIYGYHKLADYFSNPQKLSIFLEKYRGYYPAIKKYSDSMKSDKLEFCRMNGIAIFAELYWRMINKIYDEIEYHNRHENGKSSLQIPIDFFKSEIFDQLNEKFLYCRQNSLIISFFDILNSYDPLYFGEKDFFFRYLNKSIINETQKYLNVDTNKNFPFNSFIINNEQYSNDNTIKIGENQHYKITLEIEVETQVPFINCSIYINSIKFISRIPVLIFFNQESKRPIYIENAIRAAIGNLLMNSGKLFY